MRRGTVKAILIGCEYSGTTTLARGINKWLGEVVGRQMLVIHDHWKIPNTSGHEPADRANLLTEEEMDQVLALSPKLKEMTQRHSLYYHLPSPPDHVSRVDGRGETVRSNEDWLFIGYHFDDSIYGQLYFEYGRPTDPADRIVVSRAVEHALLRNTPEAILVLLRASPDVIRRRMCENPHHRGVLQEKDIEHVSEWFDLEFRRSLLTRKMTLDTTSTTPEQTLAEFVDKVRPFLTDADRSRMTFHARRRGLEG